MKLFIRVCLIIFAALFGNYNRVVFAQEPQQAVVPSISQTPQAGQPTGSTLPFVPPIIQIKPLEGQKNIYSFELRDVQIGDLFRVLAHDYKLNLLVDNEIQGQVVNASLSNVTLEEALSAIAESQNLILEKKGNIIKVSPNFITRTFTLRFVEAKKFLESSGELSKAAVTEAAGGSASLGTIYNLLSKKGKVLLGNQPNSIIVIDYPVNISKIEEFLKVIDQSMTIRVFKLKYLKASEIVGVTTVTTTSTQTTGTSAGTTTQTVTTGAAQK